MKNPGYYIRSNISLDAEFGTNFGSGDIVEHSTFGVGKVLASAGNGEHRRVSILFRNGTKRKMIVKYANLKKLWTDTWMIFLDFKVGDIIEHNRFGVGKVMSSLGTGENKRVDVLFADGTKKRLIVKYANLTKLF
jgi:hypothetical protein